MILLDAVLYPLYLPLAMGLFLGGTPVLVASFYLVLTNKVSLFTLFLITAMTTITWDIIWYYLGRKHFPNLLKLPAFRRHQKFIQKFETHSQERSLFLFLSRFVYGTSSLSTALAGLYKMPSIKFLPICFSSISIWFFVLYGVSAFFGKVKFFATPEYKILSVLIFVLAMIAFSFIARSAYRRRFLDEI